MKIIKKIQKIIADISLTIAAIGLFGVVLAIMYAVLCRFVIKANSVWVEQFSRFLLIWVVFAAANVLIYKNELMRVDFFDNMWPKKFLKVREGIYDAIFIFLLIILTWQGWEQAYKYLGVQVVGLPIDKFWVYLSVAWGSFFMLLQYILKLLSIFLTEKGDGQSA